MLQVPSQWLTIILHLSAPSSGFDPSGPHACAICHCSLPHRRMRTIPGVVDISILHSPRSATRMQCQKSRLRSRVSSSELDMISHIEIARAHLSSREIAMTTSDTASEWRSVESEVCRYPQRPGMSSFDDVVENGDISGCAKSVEKLNFGYTSTVRPRNPNKLHL